MVVFAMPETSIEVAITDAFSLISDWLNRELYDKAKLDELPILFFELTWLMNRARHILGDYQQERLHFEPIIASVSEWMANTQQTNKISPLTQAAIEQLQRIGIQDKKLLRDKKKRQLIAFLASRAQNDKVNNYRAIYLLLCLEMAKLTNFTSRINDTLDNTRFLTNKNRQFLLIFLPDIANFNGFADLHQTLHELKASDLYQIWQATDANAMQLYIEKVRKRKHKVGATLLIDPATATESELINFKIAEELHQFFLPLDNYLQQQTGITRETTPKPPPIEPQVVKQNAFVDELTGDTVEPLVSINDFDEANCGDSSTQSAEVNEPQPEPNEAYNQVSNKKRISPAVDIVKAEQQSNAMRKRKMRLSTDTQVASTYEIRTLLEKLYDILVQIDIDYSYSDDSQEHNDEISLSSNEQTSIFLLAVLLSGSTQIFKTKEWWQHAYYLAKYQFTFVPARAVLDHRFTKAFSQKNKASLNLYFPEKVGTLLQVFGSSFDDEFDDKYLLALQEQANHLLKTFNRTRQTRLTFNKVLDYLNVILSRKGEDNAIIDIIRLQPIHQTASLSYINVSQTNVIHTHEAFLKHLQDLLGLSEEAINLSIHDHKKLSLVDLIALPKHREFFRDDSESQIGTALALDEEKLTKDWIKPLKQQILLQLEKRPTSPQAFVQLHNLFSDYLFVLLGLSSGYRPVNEIFGRLEDIDTLTGMYFISDKENRIGAGEGRFIYLPSLTIQQVSFYIRYLHHYSRYFYKQQQNVAHEFDSILRNQQGLLLYLAVDNEQIIAEPLQNNRWIADRLSRYAKLPLNWYRHHIRSLKERGISLYGHSVKDNHLTPDVIGAWMGHTDELGYDYLDITSGLKRSKLKALAALINERLINYGFEAIDTSHLTKKDSE